MLGDNNMQPYAVVTIESQNAKVEADALQHLHGYLRRNGVDASPIPSEDRMDFGATLSILFSPAIIGEIVRGAFAILNNNRDTAIRIKFPNEAEIELKNVEPHQVDKYISIITDLVQK